ARASLGEDGPARAAREREEAGARLGAEPEAAGVAERRPLARVVRARVEDELERHGAALAARASEELVLGRELAGLRALVGDGHEVGEPHDARLGLEDGL